MKYEGCPKKHPTQDLGIIQKRFPGLAPSVTVGKEAFTAILVLRRRPTKAFTTRGLG